MAAMDKETVLERETREYAEQKAAQRENGEMRVLATVTQVRLLLKGLADDERARVCAVLKELCS
jgi:hypothetical protein